MGGDVTQKFWNSLKYSNAYNLLETEQKQIKSYNEGKGDDEKSEHNTDSNPGLNVDELYEQNQEDDSTADSKSNKSNKIGAQMSNKKVKKMKGKTSIPSKELASRSRSTCSNRELRNLLSDAKHGKRWATTDSQELRKLYEDLERVLTNLKEYHEHSYPFLTRVRKSDAPDYYDIITEPMDLSLMTKKLHRLEYGSKAEFQADLDLLFSNCRTYNTDPSSRIYLIHADALEKRAIELMQNVKEVDISKDIIKTEESSSRDGSEEQLPSKNKQKSTKEQIESNDEQPQENAVKSMESSPANSWYESEELQPYSDLELDQKLLKNVDNPFKDDVEYATKSDRMQYRNYRLSQLELPFQERDALVRIPKSTAIFISLEEKILQPNEEILSGNIGFYPEITHFMACAPIFERKDVNASSIKEEASSISKDVALSLLQKGISTTLKNCHGYQYIESDAFSTLVDIVGVHISQLGQYLLCDTLDSKKTEGILLIQTIERALQQAGHTNKNFMSWKKDLLGNQPNKESSSEQGDATLPTTMDVVSTTSMEETMGLEDSVAEMIQDSNPVEESTDSNAAIATTEDVNNTSQMLGSKKRGGVVDIKKQKKRKLNH